MRANGNLGPSGFFAALALATLILPAAAVAGDVATFQDLGFSSDARVYVFAQYGVDERSSFPYAELFAVDVATNRFVPDRSDVC